MCREIKEGAIFVADAHINEKREEFLEFLKAIDSSKIKTSQLFLMGDIFDLLVGGVKYTQKVNQKYIELINSISKKVEIYYFEGNHDFNLKEIFPSCSVFSYDEQPIMFKLADKKVLLLHGDKFIDVSYAIYSFVIRSKIILFVISMLDNFLKGAISKQIVKAQYKKSICKRIENFKMLIQDRLKKVNLDDVDVVLEGHFHQNMVFYIKKNKKYINIPSFACNKSFIIVKSYLKFRVEQFTLSKRR